MELTNDQHSTRTHVDGSDEELSATFREWAQTMTPEQVRYLLATGSGEHMVDHLRMKNLPVPENQARVWSLLKAELVFRLQALTALQEKENLAEKTTLLQEVPDEVLIGRLRQWAAEMTPQEALTILATCSAESLISYLRSQNRPLPSHPYKLWGLFAAELLARTETLNASHRTMGTA